MICNNTGKDTTMPVIKANVVKVEGCYKCPFPLLPQQSRKCMKVWGHDETWRYDNFRGSKRWSEPQNSQYIVKKKIIHSCWDDGGMISWSPCYPHIKWVLGHNSGTIPRSWNAPGKVPRTNPIASRDRNALNMWYFDLIWMCGISIQDNNMKMHLPSMFCGRNI